MNPIIEYGQNVGVGICPLRVPFISKMSYVIFSNGYLEGLMKYCKRTDGFPLPRNQLIELMPLNLDYFYVRQLILFRKRNLFVRSIHSA